MKVFEYSDYKKYLKDQFNSEKDSVRTGRRSAFAGAIGCQPAYLSRVLNADAHLSLEQAEKASHFLGHTTGEERFFFYLVLWNRAGTPSLRQKMGEELKALKNENLFLKNRVALRQPLSFEAQAVYYSAWYYAALHMLFDIEYPWTPELIAKTLGLSLKRVSEALAFLIENRLLKNTSKGYQILERQTHVDTESPLVAKHHINWRVKAIQSLDRANINSLHYSSVISVSHKHIPLIREIMLNAINEIRKIAKTSDPEDVLYSYCLDLFPVSETVT